MLLVQLLFKSNKMMSEVKLICHVCERNAHWQKKRKENCNK